MTINITTPSILFPAITLLMLAYTNRFLALSQLIRSLHKDYNTKRSNQILNQIKHLRTRVLLIRIMQALGALSIIFCTLSIIALMSNFQLLGNNLFIISLISFLGSISSSLIEILMSSKALNILLYDLESKR